VGADCDIVGTRRGQRADDGELNLDAFEEPSLSGSDVGGWIVMVLLAVVLFIRPR
jgi:hypothetical protein